METHTQIFKNLILCILLHIFIDIHVLRLSIVREHLSSSQNVGTIESNTALTWLTEMEVCYKQLLLTELAFALFFKYKETDLFTLVTER